MVIDESASMHSLRHLSFGFVSSMSFVSPIKVNFALDSSVTLNLMSSMCAQWYFSPQMYLFIQAHFKPYTYVEIFMKPKPPKLFLAKPMPLGVTNNVVVEEFLYSIADGGGVGVQDCQQIHKLRKQKTLILLLIS